MKVYKKDNLYFIVNDRLNIIAYGETLSLTLYDYIEHYIYYKNFFKSKRKKEFNKNGLRLKKRFKKNKFINDLIEILSKIFDK